jgi:aminomuconate-semialdehyde/2-hydroxymuconate-6-semialdehyde dehydrogenase
MNESPFHLSNLINGRLCAAKSGRYLDVFEPATGSVWARAPDSSSEDVDAAVSAAHGAFRGWAATPASQRARLLNRLADLIESELGALAQAESTDTGKPLALAASVDIPRAIANLRFFAAAALQFSSESHAMEDSGFNYTLRQPLGAVACISPWNLPLYLLTWKIAPALAAGNTVVAKPSEITPVSAWMLSRLCNDAGFPPGVLNIVHGTGVGAGAALVAHPLIKAISFTGSTRTGTAIAAEIAPKFIKISLEMGGKNPTLIFTDADRAGLIEKIVRSAFSNQGQICLCGSRILVEHSYYAQFRDEFVEAVRQLRVGDPNDPSTQQGALVSAQHQQKVLACIDTARDEGGRILCGGKAIQPTGRCATGWFVEPTVIEGLDANCRTNREEIFGPLVTLQPFDDDQQALDSANATAYGLAASIWTSNLSRAHRLAAQLEAGIVWVNCWMLRDLRTPFGGVKQSGVGREGGVEAMRFFTEAKNVCIDLG